MSTLSNVESKLPPGFRFHPKDEELIYDYLMKWIMGCSLLFPSLIEVDLNKCEPWDIPQAACVGGKEWYFYNQRDRKYATGLRTNRATASGYWKATGKDRHIMRSGALIGMRKTLVFYRGRAPKGTKTDWVMHEFRLEDGGGQGSKFSSKHAKDQDWVLCRVFCKNSQHSSPLSDQTPISGSEQENPNPNLEIVSTPSSSYIPSLPELHNHCNLGFGDNQVPCFSIPSSTNETSVAAVSMDNNHRYGNNSRGKSSPLCSPGFVDQNSETFLSEIGFSSLWNQYY